MEWIVTTGRTVMEAVDAALDELGVDVEGKVALDVGSSTGGFTDCLLQRGAVRVYAIDVGKGQLDWRLRTDPRVVSREGLNARDGFDLPETVDLVVADLSFIALRIALRVSGSLGIHRRCSSGSDERAKARDSGAARGPARSWEVETLTPWRTARNLTDNAVPAARPAG